VRTSSPFHSDILDTEVIDPFTPGYLAVPLIVINLLVLGIGVAYYKRAKERIQTWTISDFAHSFEPHVRYLLLSASTHIFGNIRVIPFITSIALLLLTYFFTANITQKKFAGIVSMALVLQSDIFVSYSTTASYDNSWIIL